MNCIGVRLGEICQEIYRYPTYYDIEYLDTGIPEIRGELITSDGSIDLNRQKWRFISENTSSKFPRTVLLKDDLVMSVRGTIGKIGLIPQEFVGANITANLIRISPNRLRVNERYLWRYMRSTEFLSSLDNASSSTTIKTIKAPDLKDIRIPLPPLEEQRRIAEVLDRAEELRSKRREAIAQLDTLTKAIFIEMFGDPKSNPKNWPVKFMAALFATSPIFGTMIPPVTEKLGWLSLRVGNIQNWSLDLSDRKYVDLPPESIERHRVKDGDLLLARAIASQDHLGKCVVAHPSGENWAFDSHLMRLRFDRNLTEPEFIRHLFMTTGGRSLFLSASRKSTVQFNINTKEIAALRIPVPPIYLQQEFARRVESVEKLKTTHRASLSELDALFASLQHRAFRGEL